VESSGNPVLTVVVLRRIARRTKQAKRNIYLSILHSSLFFHDWWGRKIDCLLLTLLSTRERCVHTRLSRGSVLRYWKAFGSTLPFPCRESYRGKKNLSG